MKNEVYNLSNPFVPCSALIFLDAKCLSSTYCAREHGHKGEHNTANEEPLPKTGTR